MLQDKNPTVQQSQSFLSSHFTSFSFKDKLIALKMHAELKYLQCSTDCQWGHRHFQEIIEYYKIKMLQDSNISQVQLVISPPFLLKDKLVALKCMQSWNICLRGYAEWPRVIQSDWGWPYVALRSCWVTYGQPVELSVTLGEYKITLSDLESPWVTHGDHRWP